jgi:hypothetical protein
MGAPAHLKAIDTGAPPICSDDRENVLPEARDYDHAFLLSVFLLSIFGTWRRDRR